MKRKITFFVEFDPVSDGDWPSWKPGYFIGPTKRGFFRRIWWGPFAVAWIIDMNLYEWNRHVASGQTEWRKK